MGKRTSNLDTTKIRNIARRKMIEDGFGRYLDQLEAGNASDDAKYTWKQYYGAAYYEEQKAHRKKTAKFWLQMSAGNLSIKLKEMGLLAHADGTVTFMDCGAPVLQSYVQRCVLKELEKLGITGIKIPKRISGMSRNILDFSNATVVEKKEEEQDEEDSVKNI